MAEFSWNPWGDQDERTLGPRPNPADLPSAYDHLSSLGHAVAEATPSEETPVLEIEIGESNG